MMKKRHIHISIVTLIILTYCFTLGVSAPTSTASTNSLRDISNSYAREQIRALQSSGIVSGDEKGYFHPENPVTRAEFVSMLDRTLGIKPVASSVPSFTDVPKSSWAYGYVQAAVSLDMANGTSSTTFSPNRTISRQEAATFLVRAMGLQASSTATPSVKDANAISNWARPAVSAAIKKQWLVGYQGYFRPGAALSREETAVILKRILDELNATTVSAKPLVSLGWQYQSTTQEFIAQVQKSGINTLSPRWYFLQKNGSISDYTDASLVHWAQKNGKEVWALFGNQFDPTTTHAVLSDKSKRTAVVQKLVSFVDKYQLDGINVDFEGFNPDDRDNFTAFIKELGTALHAKGAVLSVDVPPDTGTDWSEPFDYEKLALHADYVVLMAYEEHWVGSPKAGSVASLPWFENVIKGVLDDVPAQKLIAGIPLYTRDWYSAGGQVQSTDISIPESYQLISQYKTTTKWDEALGQYRSTFTKQGVSHSIWLEESRSLGLKAQTSLTWQIGGLAYWYIGSESTDVWTSIANSIALKQARQKM
ncbi:S-layer homology domain-containing protein [Brevibacillus choshinensis]|nr:S-layer homology domain-containing protein [Brevibacillus choshinensis]